MALGNFHGNFDPRTYKKFQEIVGKGNLTRKLEEFMTNYVAQFSENLDDINLELLNIEIVRLQNEKTKIDAQLQAKLTLKEQIENKLNEAEEIKLKKEKERIETINKCINCGKDLKGKKSFKFNSGSVCRSCYLSSCKEDINKWNNG